MSRVASHMVSKLPWWVKDAIESSEYTHNPNARGLLLLFVLHFGALHLDVLHDGVIYGAGHAGGVLRSVRSRLGFLVSSGLYQTSKVTYEVRAARIRSSRRNAVD